MSPKLPRLAVVALLVCGGASAEEGAEANTTAVEDVSTGASSHWDGTVEVGLIATSGNSDTQSFNAKLSLQKDEFPWRHEFRMEALRAADDSGTTAERYTAAGKSDYRLDEFRYVYGTLRYEDDRFSGFDYRVSETLGYGHRVLDRDGIWLDLEIGAGARHSKPIGCERTDEAIARVAENFGWQISPSAELNERVFIETGSDNTYTEAEVGLKLRINGNLATRISYNVRHNSDVPPGTENTDTTTSVTLVYDF